MTACSCGDSSIEPLVYTLEDTPIPLRGDYTLRRTVRSTWMNPMAQTLPATLLEAPRKDSGLEQGDAVLESKGAEFLAYAETILTDENLIEAALRDRGTQNFHRKYPNYGRPARGWGSYRLGDPK